jgi:AraC-like DNA-binding protein
VIFPRGDPHVLRSPGSGTASVVSGFELAMRTPGTRLRAGGPGSDLVMARLSDALLIRALRHYGDTVDRPGWLAGLRDPYVAAAVATQVGYQSDVAFAAAFKREVGRSPGAYRRAAAGRLSAAS